MVMSGKAVFGSQRWGIVGSVMVSRGSGQQCPVMQGRVGIGGVWRSSVW